MAPMLSLANTHSSNLKVEDGSVLLYGRKIADYSNLSFAACNTEYTTLKEKIESLDKEIVQFRAMGIEELKPMILSKSSERNRLYEDLKALEEQLFNIALSVNRMTSSGLPVSERKRMAIEMFEKGNIKGVIEVLNENDLALDAERAKAEIARGKQLVEVGNATIESGVQKIRSLVEEYEMRAEALMADNTVADRLQQACQAYEQVIALAREHLTEEELAKKLYKIATFLYKQNVFGVAEDYFTECLGIYRRLAENNPAAISCTIRVNEMMGSELHLHVVVENGDKLIVRVPTVTLDDNVRGAMVYGATVYVTFEGKVMHFFDPETEKNLLV